MADVFSIGDVVRLKNQPGSPKMTVNTINGFGGSNVECVWFVENGSYINSDDKIAQQWDGPFRESFSSLALENA